MKTNHDMEVLNVALVIKKQPVPLQQDSGGAVRVSGTRVTLDSVVYSFRDGASAEEIVQQYPSLDLGDVYAVLAYYLRNQVAVDQHITENEQASAALRLRVEKEFPTTAVRRRLLARRKNKTSSH